MRLARFSVIDDDLTPSWPSIRAHSTSPARTSAHAWRITTPPNARAPETSNTRRSAVRYAPGDRIDDRYEICAVLGSGGFAEVYRAIDTRSGRDVVLKVPQVALAG